METRLYTYKFGDCAKKLQIYYMYWYINHVSFLFQWMFSSLFQQKLAIYSENANWYTVEYQYNAIYGVHKMGPHYKWYRIILAYWYMKYDVLYQFEVHEPIVL